MIVEKTDLFKGKVHLNTVRPLLANALKEDRDDIPDDMDPQELLKKYPDTSLAKQQVEMVAVGSEKTSSNIMISALAPLGVFYSRPSLTDMLSTPDICLG